MSQPRSDQKRKRGSDRGLAGSQPQVHEALSAPRFHRALSAAIGLGWIALVIGANRDVLSYSLRALRTAPLFFQQIGWPDFGRGIPLILLSLLLLTALGIGRLLLQLFSFDGVGFEEELIFSLGLGLGSISLGALLLGISGHFTVTAIRFSLAALACASAVLNIFFVPKKPGTLAATEKSSKFWPAVISCILAGLILLTLFAAMGPEVLYDSLVYHLALPKLYLLNGRIIPTPYNVYSGVPFNTEMLYGVGLALGGESVAKLIPWGVGIAVLSLIFVWVRKHSSVEAALLSALLFYSFPMVADTSAHCYVELSWCFYGLLAVAALALGAEPGRLTNRRAVLIGLLSGLCIGTKYNAFGVPLIIVGILALKAARQEISLGRFAAMTGVLILTTALAVAPWFLKNLAFYRNPVFPFFNEWFSRAPQGVDWRGLAADASGRDLNGAFTTLSGFLGLFSPLWPRINTDDSMSLGYGFYFFLPWLFLQRWKSASYRELSLALLLAFAVWALQTSMFRFFLFGLPLLAMLIGTAIASWEAPENLRKAVYGLAVIACLLSSAQTLRLWQVYGTWKVVFGQVGKDEFLSHEEPVYPTPPYAAIRFVNEKLPQDSKVLFFHEARAFHCDRNFIASSAFAQNPIVVAANESQNADELAARLRGLGITHILFNKAEMTRIQARLPLSRKGESILTEFWKTHLKTAFENRIEVSGNYQWVAVLEIKKPRI